MKVANSFMLCALATVLAALPVRAQQQETTPGILREVDISQNLNTQIPPGIAFRDENGKIVHLGDFLGTKPILLSLVYFECPALCTEVLNGELRTMDAISLDLGKDFDAVTVSFEPKDTPCAGESEARRLHRPIRPPRRRGELALPDGRSVLD